MRNKRPGRDGRSRAPLRSQAGATLGELLVGMAVLGIALGGAALALPEIIDDVDLKGAARTVYGDLSYARTTAIASNSRYRFVIGTGRNYQLHEDRDSDSAIDDAELVASKKLGEGRTGVTFGTSTDIVFAPDGTAISYGSVNVQDGDGETRTVVVNAAGHIKIQ